MIGDVDAGGLHLAHRALRGAIELGIELGLVDLAAIELVQRAAQRLRGDVVADLRIGAEDRGRDGAHGIAPLIFPCRSRPGPELAPREDLRWMPRLTGRVPTQAQRDCRSRVYAPVAEREAVAHETGLPLWMRSVARI
jgi:hypothetical protein